MPAAVLAGAKAVTASVAVAVTLLHVAATLASWRRGTRPSAPRMLLLAGTAAFFWHVNVVVDDALLAIVLFEIFHDVQYLSIVWIFNRRRVDTDPKVGAFTRFLFRPKSGLLVLYVLLVFLYGTLHLVQDGLGSGPVERALAGLLAASALLHFYYDGFIWKPAILHRDGTLRDPRHVGRGIRARGSGAFPDITQFRAKAQHLEPKLFQPCRVYPPHLLLRDCSDSGGTAQTGRASRQPVQLYLFGAGHLDCGSHSEHGDARPRFHPLLRRPVP